jgi:colanic acid biosynthesis glycosyl transferase WcaI
MKSLSVLWVVTELYYPENNQTGYYMTGIAEGLANEYEVKVICGQPNYARRGTRAPVYENHNSIEIFRVWGTTFDKNILPFRLVNMATLGISMFLKTICKIKKNDEILVVSAPPTLPFLTALAAKIRNAKYTLIIQDKYPEAMVAVGQLKSDGLSVKVLSKLNLILYRNAERIVAVGRDMKELVVEQLDLPEETSKPLVAVIQNWASLEEIQPLRRNESYLLQELGLLEKFVFLYAGNMGHPQDIESILECIKKLKNDSRFHFLFIGSGVKRKWLEHEMKMQNFKNLTLLSPRPREEQNQFLNSCDVGLVSLVKNMKGAAMPSRTYNFLAAGKPILALTETGSEVERVIEEDNVGWHVPPNEPEQLLKMIYKIYNEREKIPQMQKSALKSAQKNYSIQTAIEKYKSLLRARV